MGERKSKKGRKQAAAKPRPPTKAQAAAKRAAAARAGWETRKRRAAEAAARKFAAQKKRARRRKRERVFWEDRIRGVLADFVVARSIESRGSAKIKYAKWYQHKAEARWAYGEARTAKVIERLGEDMGLDDMFVLALIET
jgi:hypothetical protein